MYVSSFCQDNTVLKTFTRLRRVGPSGWNTGGANGTARGDGGFACLASGKSPFPHDDAERR